MEMVAPTGRPARWSTGLSYLAGAPRREAISPARFARGGRCRSRAATSPVRVVVPPVRAVRPVTAAAQAVRTHALVRVERPKDDAGEEERDDVCGVHQRIALRAAPGLCDLGHCRVDECD